MRVRPVRARRRGQSLVLLVPILFTCFAMAGLLIDLGLVRVAQARMTGACDTAALEAMRWRDATPLRAAPDAAPSAPAVRDADRRAAAAALGDAVFANPPADDPTSAAVLPFDAGPQFDVTVAPDGVQATIQPLPAGYKPHLQSNVTANRNDGDIVAGTYDPAQPHLDGTRDARGDFTPYDRDDLQPAAAGAAAANAPAVLVRLRRVRANAEQGVDGVSTIGPSLPLLFGRGAMLGRSASDDAYSVRRDGFSVRAAAIAVAAPAVAAALPQVTTVNSASLTLAGVQPVALSVAFWNALPAVDAAGNAAPQAVTLGANGALTANGVAAGYLWHAVPTTAVGWTTIGTPAADVPRATTGDAVLGGAVQGFFPIYATTSDGQQTPTLTQRIVAFGYARWDPAAGTVTKLSQVGVANNPKGYVAPTNATADLAAAWPTLALLNDHERQQVLLANGQAADTSDAALDPITPVASDTVRAAAAVRATDN